MSAVERRKSEHIEFALSESGESTLSNLFEDVQLPPVSVPSFSIDAVDVSASFLGHRLATPLVISGMTGGHPAARELNANIAAGGAAVGAAIGVGSQRAGLENPAFEGTYEIVRERAPSSFVIGNIGMSQLIAQGTTPGFGSGEIERAVAMVRADALAIHLNAVEELVQPEGDRVMEGLMEAIGRTCADCSVPVVAKETGSGMTRETADALAAAGVAALDVGGAGGTSFARIEGLRAAAMEDPIGARLGETFAGWGFPTALSVIEVRDSGLPVVATGGVRDGLDAAKALALGATMVGIGGPIIRAAQESADAVIAHLLAVLEELKVAMVLTGCRTIADLQRLDVAVIGRLADWLAARGLAVPRRGSADVAR